MIMVYAYKSDSNVRLIFITRKHNLKCQDFSLVDSRRHNYKGRKMKKEKYKYAFKIT